MAGLLFVGCSQAAPVLAPVAAPAASPASVPTAVATSPLPSPTPTSVPTVAAETAAPTATPAAPVRLLTGAVDFGSQAPLTACTLKLFMLGHPAVVVVRSTLKTDAKGACTYSVELPASVPAGAIAKVVVTTSSKLTLVGLVPVPAARELADVTPETVVTLASSLAYVLLELQLEGAGQASVSSKGDLARGLLSTLSSVYLALDVATQSALTSFGSTDLNAALYKELSAALTTVSGPIPAPIISRLMVLAPALQAALVTASHDIVSATDLAVAAGAPKPDIALFAPISLTGVGAAAGGVAGGGTGGGGTPDPDLARANTRLGIVAGDVDQPDTPPSLAPDP